MALLSAYARSSLVARSRGLRVSAALAASLSAAVLFLGWEWGMIVVPNYAANIEHALQEQFDGDNAAVCAGLGFMPGSAQHASCKRDLADLERRHEQLRAEYELP